MTWRLSVRHSTQYRYEGVAGSSYNEARLEPRSDRHQTVLSSKLEVTPSARVSRHVDYWGTVVHHFDLQVPHAELSVVSSTVVETGTSPAGPGDVSWDDLGDAALMDRFCEVLAPTETVTPDDTIVAIADGIRSGAATPAAAAEAAVGWVHDHLEYLPGSTGVHSTAAEVLGSGSGVCQDFAHLSLAILRSLGIPSWYVSGYLHPTHDAEVDEPAIGESHAWVAAWTGHVWPLDPTSMVDVGERHLRVAAGREYHDVPPFRGVYAGDATQSLTAKVEITRTG